ncbi:rhodanese-like domain-containing protein [Cryobacterium sp. PH31-L1]|uniref:rhodanese-like domain-containing protein n=1 Tax=Cryobacterium sp. PH31-L1 TaxID=3046199 RepID=UPI0024BBC89B|nr:rhodanese-like domain-containing protein [Cryobacterium sp. PH31-L1]MDJ0376983.1 rhodanese-like domain-containing protein [Cryobacterium sp. PH31-L1]
MLDYLTAKLAYEVDVLDAAAGLDSGEYVLVDTRMQASWDHGHALGAIRLQDAIPAGRTVVVYGWGPGCNGATQAAAALIAQGHSVREMIGGFEYWYRSGLAVETATGIIHPPVDPLVGAAGVAL